MAPWESCPSKNKPHQPASYSRRGIHGAGRDSGCAEVTVAGAGRGDVSAPGGRRREAVVVDAPRRQALRGRRHPKGAEGIYLYKKQEL